MKYHNYYPLSKGMSFGVQEAYEKLCGAFIQKKQLAHASITYIEGLWVHRKKPYYNVPSEVQTHLLSLDLINLNTDDIKLEQPAITLRFPIHSEVWGCHSILVGLHTISTIRVLVLAAQGDWSGSKFCCLPFEGNTRDVFDKINEDTSKLAGFESRDQVQDIVQIICGTSLMAKVPEVLNSDTNKPITAELVEKAWKRGKVGWSLVP